MNLAKRLLGGILSFCHHKEIHAFRIQLNGRIYYVCARCSGLYLGIFAGFPIAALMLLYAPQFYSMGDFGTTLIAILISIPAIVDWSTQRLAFRESRNGIRFWTALPTGFALSWYLLSPVSFFVKLPVLVSVLLFIVIFSFIDKRPLYDEITEAEVEFEENSEN
ncbi:MAG: DUF2085 domain-containing protein [Candidatus Thorarchaeota archaeon]